MTSTWKMYANRAHNYYERKCSVYISVHCTMYRIQKYHRMIWSLVCIEYVICMELKHRRKHQFPLTNQNDTNFGSVSGRFHFPYILDLFVIPLDFHYFANTVRVTGVLGLREYFRPYTYWSTTRRERKTNPFTSFRMKTRRDTNMSLRYRRQKTTSFANVFGIFLLYLYGIIYVVELWRMRFIGLLQLKWHSKSRQ